MWLLVAVTSLLVLVFANRRDPTTIHITRSTYQQIVLDKCERFVQPLLERRQKCVDETPATVVDVCINFATDVEFILPSLMHHLALGVRKVHIYNNDAELAWYHHPAITCLVSKELLEIQTWYGAAVGLKGYNHCIEKVQNSDIPVSVRKTDVWAAIIDMDEFIVLHDDNCINTFVSKVEAPGYMMPWAFYVPELPLEGFHYHSGLPQPDILFPHELVTTRHLGNRHVKTLARVSCVQHWGGSPHNAVYSTKCPYGSRPMNASGVTVPSNALHEHPVNDYKHLQLNHYWIISVHHFLRKMHRGFGSEMSKHHVGSMRGTQQMITQLKITPLVNDTIFLRRYGDYFEELKRSCLECFNLTLFYSYTS